MRSDAQDALSIHYTPEQWKIVRRFEALRTGSGWDMAKAGKQIGCAPSTYSQIINRKYAGRWAYYIQEMARVLARAERREKAIKDPPYTLTANAEEIEGLCSICLDQCSMGLVQGPQGSCKTVTVMAYATAHVADTILLIAHPRFNGLALLRKLAEHEQCDWRGVSFDVLFDRLVLHLANRGRPMLLVDDCDNMKPEALHTIRQIYDQAGTPVVLLGTPDFLETMRRRRSGLTAQALGRITHVITLGGIGQDDAEKLTVPFGLPSSACLLAWTHCGGDARLLVEGCKAALIQAQAMDEKINEQHIDRAFEKLRDIRR